VSKTQKPTKREKAAAALAYYTERVRQLDARIDAARFLRQLSKVDELQRRKRIAENEMNKAAKELAKPDS
jgi:hypothetical protein